MFLNHNIMKQTLRVLAAAALLFTFAACDPLEDNVTPDDNTSTVTQTDVEYTIGNAEWSVENNYTYATITWTAKIKTEGLHLSEFFDEDMQQSYSYGIGYFPVGAENNLPRYFNGSNDQSGCYHRIISANSDSTELTVVSHIKADNRKEARAYLYLVNEAGSGDFYYSERFYMDPADMPGHSGEASVEIEYTSYDDEDELLTVVAKANFGDVDVPYAVGICYSLDDPDDENDYPTIDDPVFNVMDHVTGPNQYDDYIGELTLGDDGKYSITFFVPMYNAGVYNVRGYLQLRQGGDVIYSENQVVMTSAK